MKESKFEQLLMLELRKHHYAITACLVIRNAMDVAWGGNKNGAVSIVFVVLEQSIHVKLPSRKPENKSRKNKPSKQNAHEKLEPR